MFLPGRGVRPFARGGAFTAGADDLNSLGYNPAGLADILDFSSIVVFSGCPGSTICTPEDRQFDAPAQIRDQTVVPSANFGVQGVWDGFRLGASLQLPVWVSSDAQIRVPALPPSPYFDSAHLVGDSATLSFTLPLVARLGAEIRPSSSLRIEAEVDY